MTSPLPSWDEFLRHLRDAFPAAAWSVLILILTYLGSRVASGRLRGTLQRGGFQLNVAILLARALWLGVWIVGFLLVLYQFGIGLTPLAATIGIIGLALSLSLQAVLQNLVAGIYLLAERPFHIGDHIAVIGPAGANHEGRVEDIQMRTTHLRNQDDELILVPNSAIFSGVVTNRTAVGGFARHLTITFPRSTQLEAAQNEVIPLLQRVSSALAAPAPELRVQSIGADSWTADLIFWAASGESDSQVAWAIIQTFPDATVDQRSGA